MHFELVRPEEKVALPVRATTGSCGYDFFLPTDVIVPAHQVVSVATNITVAHDKRDPYHWVDEYPWVLYLYPRSSLGIKKHLMLANTTGVIDSDYCGFEIHVFLYNYGEEDVSLKAGDRFCQGVFMPYFLTSDDSASGDRHGGFGSTGN